MTVNFLSGSSRIFSDDYDVYIELNQLGIMNLPVIVWAWDNVGYGAWPQTFPGLREPLDLAIALRSLDEAEQ